MSHGGCSQRVQCESSVQCQIISHNLTKNHLLVLEQDVLRNWVITYRVDFSMFWSGSKEVYALTRDHRNVHVFSYVELGIV